MAKWNKDKKLLDQQRNKFWKFDLKEVDEPNLQKEIFPYTEISKIVFDHRIIPIEPGGYFYN